MMQIVKRLVLIVVVLVAGWWLFQQVSQLPSFTNWWKPKPVTIDATPVLLEHIQPLAQLVTVSAYDEIVVDSSQRTTIGERLSSLLNPFKFEKVYSEKKLVVIGKSITHVGIDLQYMSANNLQVTNDSIHVILPPAAILDVIVNPSGTEVFLEQGKWDAGSVERLKQKIQTQAAQRAVNKGLLQQSEAKARQVFTAFFMAAGFKKVTIAFKDTRLM